MCTYISVGIIISVMLGLFITAFMLSLMNIYLAKEEKKDLVLKKILETFELTLSIKRKIFYALS